VVAGGDARGLRRQRRRSAIDAVDGDGRVGGGVLDPDRADRRLKIRHLVLDEPALGPRQVRNFVQERLEEIERFVESADLAQAETAAFFVFPFVGTSARERRNSTSAACRSSRSK
jgi:hypothetical protein